MATLDEVLEKLDEIKKLIEDIKGKGGAGSSGQTIDPAGTYFRQPGTFVMVDPHDLKDLDGGDKVICLRLRQPRTRD
ncbi:MAG: hypothetical protein PHT60_00965 [Acidiphilium sp.]|nr:hypothetical protein [Acidiphilium sp.]MDD4934326.1 hypothetical protein [Acidiphilium sp.]